MSDVSDWSEECPQTIVWERKTGRDQYGKPTYAAPVTFAPPTGGRRANKISRIAAGVNGVAVDVLSESVMWLLATPDIGTDDLVYVQGDTKRPPILRVEQPPDEDGPHHTKIFFGKFTG